jgi:hypothetical protein
MKVCTFAAFRMSSSPTLYKLNTLFLNLPEDNSTSKRVICGAMTARSSMMNSCSLCNALSCEARNNGRLSLKICPRHGAVKGFAYEPKFQGTARETIPIVRLTHTTDEVKWIDLVPVSVAPRWFEVALGEWLADVGEDLGG